MKQGYTWVVDADIKSYFDSIPHNKMMEGVEEQIEDGEILKMIEGYLGQGVMEGLERWEGAVISPLLANIYLNRLDHEMARRGYVMVILICYLTLNKYAILPSEVKTFKGGHSHEAYHYCWPFETGRNKGANAIIRESSAISTVAGSLYYGDPTS